MDNITNLVKKYIIINTVYTAAAIFYLCIKVALWDVSVYTYIGLVGLVVILIYSHFLYQKNYYNKYSLVFSSIYLLMLIMSLSIVNDDQYLVPSSMLALTTFIVEILIILSVIKRETKQYIALIYLIITFGICTRIHNIFEYSLKQYALLAFFVLVVTVIIIIIQNNINELFNVIEGQKVLLKENEEVYEELNETQLQMKEDNRELEENRNELTKANESINKINAEMFIQNELLRYISSTLEIDQLMELVTDSIIGAAGVDICSILIFDKEQNQLRINVKSNLEIDISDALRESYINGELEDYKYMNYTYVDSAVDMGKYPFIKFRETGSIIIIPLINEGEHYGLLIAEKSEKDTLNTGSVQFYEGIANQINIAIINARIYTKIEDMAKKDFLTGLYNRRFLQLSFYELFNEAKETNGVLTTILFDIDHFKNVNDTYGHLFGDEALKMVSKITMDIACKYNGMAGRYGGEEFVIVFKNKEVDEVYAIMKELQDEVKSTDLIYEEDTIVHINISIGISSYPRFGDNADNLLNRADNAMYYSKVNGRGRITIDSEELEKISEVESE